MKTFIFRLLLMLMLLLIVTQLPTRAASIRGAAPTGPAAHPAPFVQEHVRAGSDDVVGVPAQHSDRPITRSQANASVTGCAALTYRILLPLIVRSSSSAMAVTGANQLQPDRAMPVDSAHMAVQLTAGQRPLQIGLLDGVIDPQRAAVVRGQVCDRNGQAIAGAQITVLNHAEYGSTLTGADGLFDLTVNGGGLITIVYTKTGYLPSQRQVQAPWQDYTWLPDIVLLPLDAQVTTVNLNTAGMQVARGSTSSDGDGSRRATLLIPQSTQAELVLPNGLTQTVTTLHVRATEYTVGKAGPLAMPAQLPASSGYTYALEYSVDEGLAAGAADVRFSQPLFHYVENFLKFPVGTAVPVGYYDKAKATWIPSDNGRVIKMLTITSGLANLDTDGDGVTDNGAVITSTMILTITVAERQQLAGLYQPGQSLWRVPITHFTPWDCNWPYGPPPGAAPPSQKPDPKPPLDCSSCQGGSIIEAQNQTLGEELRLSNAPFSLIYRSDRVTGRIAAYTLDIPLSSTSVPTGLKRIELEVFIAGQRYTQQFSAAPNQQTRFTWDGKDAYGQTLQGQQRITTRIGYVYSATYQQPAQLAQGFAALSGVPFTANPARQEVTLWQNWSGLLGTLDARVLGLGGWSLNVHHVYDPKSKTLYLGDGTRRSTESLGAGVISTFAGGGSVPGAGIGDGGPATQAELAVPNSVAVGPDGSVYIAETYHFSVRRVDETGIITTVAGGAVGFSGDGGPAISATLNTPHSVAVAPDGSFYIADLGNNRVRRVDANGIITTVVGTGVYGFSGDGGPATLARINGPYGVALGPDGSLYIADRDNSRVRQVGSDGIITTVAGGGACGGTHGDGGPATLACLSQPWRVAVGPDGGLYIMDRGHYRVRRVGPDGIITTVAGNGTGGYSGDGGPATLAQLGSAEDVAVGSDGALYIADRTNWRVRQVGPDGIINTVAGNGTHGRSGDGGLAIRAQLDEPIGLAQGPDGSLYIADWFNQRVRRVTPLLPSGSAGNLILPSADASQIYIFTGSGRHLKTLDALTGAVLYQFAYDGAFHLTLVTDVDGNVTSILRNGSGQPTTIVGPYGSQTTVTTDANGYLTSLINPASESIQLVSSSGGLLTSMTDARGHTYQFTYDSLGRLTRDADPAGGVKTLERVDAGQSYTVTLSTALNRTTTYQVTSRLNGDQDRTNTWPNGTLVKKTRNPASTTTTQSPDGTLTAVTLGSDPRWGMLVNLPSSVTITTPNSLSLSIGTTRTAMLTDTSNVFSLGALTQTTVINNRFYTRTYNTVSRTFADTTPEKRLTFITIDSQGRVVQEQESGLLATSYTYDNHGRLSTITEGSEPETRLTTYTYTSNNDLATITDPLSRTVAFGYDAAGRMLTQTLPDSRQISFAYDANGNLTAVVPPGRPAHTFAYTAVDLTSEYTPPAVGSVITPTRYIYNVDRQLTRITRPDGQPVDFRHDGAGRQNGVTVARGTISTTFNPTTGNLATISAPGGIGLSYTYDGALLTSETWSGPIIGAVSRAHDNNFRVISTSVNGGQIVNLQYDKDNLLTQVGALTLTRSALNGLLTGSQLGGVTDTIGYNGFAEPITYSATYNGTMLYDVQRARDKLGRITAITETIAGVTATYIYGYDATGRLISVNQNGATIASYTYDGNGNRLSFTGPGGTLTGTYDHQDRLTQYGTATYAYTANGELYRKTVSGQSTQYEYDALGNLITVTLPGGTQISYLVDGANRRIGKRVNVTLVQGWLYQDDLRPIAELDGNNTIVSRFVYASRDTTPDYLIKGGVTYRIIADQLGSPRLVVNTATGAVAQRLDYDAFGNVITDTNPGFQPFGFAGGLYDRDTRLVRFGTRDYAAETGRWTAKDTILFAGGDTNLYGYVGNDPVDYRDPSGTGGESVLPKWLSDKIDKWACKQSPATCCGQKRTACQCDIDPGANDNNPGPALAACEDAFQKCMSKIKE